MNTSFREAVAALADLQELGKTYAAREEEIEKAFQGERGAILRKGQQAIESAERLAEEGRMAASGADEARRQGWSGIHRVRLQRAQAGQELRRRLLPGRVREFRERLKSEAQGQRFYHQRLRDSGIAETQKSLEAALGELQPYRDALKRERRVAVRNLSGFSKAAELAGGKESVGEVVAPGDLARGAEDVKEAAKRISDSFAVRFFRTMPPAYLLLFLIPIGICLLAPQLSNQVPRNVAYGIAGGFGGIALLIGLIRLISGGAVMRLARDFSEKASTHESALETGERKARKQAEARIAEWNAEFEGHAGEAEQHLAEVEPRVQEYEAGLKSKLETQYPRVEQALTTWLETKLAQSAGDGSSVAAAEKESTRARMLASAQMEREIGAWERKKGEELARLSVEWRRETEPLLERAREYRQAPELRPIDWNSPVLRSASGVEAYAAAVRFGVWTPGLGLGEAGRFPRDSRFSLPQDTTDALPVALTLPREGSLLWETEGAAGEEVVGVLHGVILRALLSMPPGKAVFTFFDPVGLGKNFAGLMHLGDYEETLVNRRIWTQRDQFEERLAEISEHIEKVIQMYLRDDYASITEYNEQAGAVAEKYHFLVIADFPAQFSESAAQRLRGILTSGPRCGVFTLIHRDVRGKELEDFFSKSDLFRNCVWLNGVGPAAAVMHKGRREPGSLVLETLPADLDQAALIHEIGRRSVDSNRVEVPFSQISPSAGELWSFSTADELRVPIGRTGATKLQYLAMGKGTRQHALVAGKTGSGKSTLFHVIITNLALRCSPDELEFYLIDFKKGVEFKAYADRQLPHARVIAIESDREFGLSVLRRVDEELRRRGDLFRKAGVQDLPGYRKLSGGEALPRCLLLIDEFQEFFVDDDEVAQSASLLFDRIVRQGRAFGIHVILGSQTLGGSYSLPRSTLGQMVIRIALQMNEADAHLIMDENNSAPRLLTRPGEGIYNDAAGALEGNSPFQVCWISDEERDARLAEIQDRPILTGDGKRSVKQPIVFEGNTPADPKTNEELLNALQNPGETARKTFFCDLGAPNSIKGPARAVFHRQSGAHLLVVGQVEERTRALLAACVLSLAAQSAGGSPEIAVVLGGGPDTEERQAWDSLLAAFPERVKVRGVEPARLGDLLAAWDEELTRREDGGEGEGRFLIVPGLHRLKALRPSDDFSFSFDDDASDGGGKPSAVLERLFKDGSAHGMHVLVSTDSFANAMRGLGRKRLSEISVRILLQMSANDSASLMDSPQASHLGPNRAALYHEQEGAVEVFRPYFFPDPKWVRETFESKSHLV